MISFLAKTILFLEDKAGYYPISFKINDTLAKMFFVLCKNIYFSPKQVLILT